MLWLYSATEIWPLWQAMWNMSEMNGDTIDILREVKREGGGQLATDLY